MSPPWAVWEVVCALLPPPPPAHPSHQVLTSAGSSGLQSCSAEVTERGTPRLLQCSPQGAVCSPAPFPVRRAAPPQQSPCPPHPRAEQSVISVSLCDPTTTTVQPALTTGHLL